MITKNITSKKFVLKNICPYSEQFEDGYGIDRVPDSDKLEYARLKFNENREAEIDFLDEISIILSDDRDDIIEAVRSIQKKAINYFQSSLINDFHDQYEEYLLNENANRELRIADDIFESKRYDHAA